MPRTPRKPAAPTTIDAVRHQDTRTNIPTEELREFVAEVAVCRVDGPCAG